MHWTRFTFVLLIGALAGFAVPRLSTASEGHRTQSSGVAIGEGDGKKEESKTECKCAPLICKSSDGIRHVGAACSVKCHAGQVSDCTCGSCSDSGNLDKMNACRCKTGG